MKLVTLVENTAGTRGCIAEHGLSVYIETEKHTLLMDTGQTDAILKNASVLGLDLSAVDTVILSHGHYDHAGGILPFCQINDRAVIYMQRLATEPHYNGTRYIGIDPAIPHLPVVRLLDGDCRLDDELFLFSGITGRRCFPEGNRVLRCIKDGVPVQDLFLHEQCLVITQNGKRYLLSGCAHNGILNILDRFRGLFGTDPDVVISGFHMMKRDGSHTQAEISVILETAKALSETNAVFFSGHCTGTPAFELMKTILGDRLIALHSGTVIQ